jgi:hypothetical protein
MVLGVAGITENFDQRPRFLRPVTRRDSTFRQVRKQIGNLAVDSGIASLFL